MLFVIFYERIGDIEKLLRQRVQHCPAVRMLSVFLLRFFLFCAQSALNKKLQKRQFGWKSSYLYFRKTIQSTTETINIIVVFNIIIVTF